MTIMDQFSTQSVAKGVAEVADLTIEETATTRMIFKPTIHECKSGVRGFLIRQKKNEKGEWPDTGNINFRTADPGAFVSIQLKTEVLKNCTTICRNCTKYKARALNKVKITMWLLEKKKSL